VLVDSFGTGTVSDAQLGKLVRDVFELKPAGIIKTLQLKKPIYQRTASYGHFGRTPDGAFFTWERTDKVGDLKSAAGRR